MTNNRDFKVLDDREHVLLRPGMYLGQTEMTKKEMWLYNKDDKKFYYSSIEYVPALIKYISEIIDNSIDVAIDTDFKYGNKIQVNITSNSVEVIDNGIGIPCKSPDDENTTPNNTCVVAAWTKLKSGTSFSANRKKIGTYGVGASCCNIFSKLFIGESDDGTYKQTLRCKDNMTVISAGKIKESSGKSGVRVYCEPDLERFNLTEITKEHIDLVYQRLIMLAISFPAITFTFNKERIHIDGKKLAYMFHSDPEYAFSNNTKIVVFQNEYDEFKQFSYVNGIETSRGGEHVEYITNEITRRVRDSLVKKFKNIKPGDIKNKICVSIVLTDFVNPQFDAQTKERLSESPRNISNHLGYDINFDKLVKSILKNENIINPIIDTFKLKEELKTKNELNRVKRVKVKSDKYMPPIGKNKRYLALCEGDSAASGISASLGRDGIGYYAMKGLPLNAYDSSMQKIVANQELKDIVNILGLDISSKEDNKTIDFDHIMITSDNDADGSHITAMLIGWFRRFAPNLFDEGKICKLITPLIIIVNKKDEIEEYFFDVNSFKKWEESHKDNKNRIIYQKGLGSWDREHLIYLMDKYGVDNFIQEYKLTSDGDIYIEDWLGPDAEKRKEHLRNFNFDIDKV